MDSDDASDSADCARSNASLAAGGHAPSPPPRAHDASRTLANAPMIVVDTNAGETPLFAILAAKFGSEAVERKRLDVGDVELHAPDSDRTIVIERKTWLDFAASLRDGRYNDQKARLLADGCAFTVHLHDDTAVTCCQMYECADRTSRCA